MPSEDLWGDLPAASSVRLPSTILAEQASLLGSKTRNVLEGRVSVIRSEDCLTHDLDIVVPALDNYVYTIASVRHGIELYPLTMTDVANGGYEIACADEESFVERLRHVLTSEKVRRVIASLQAQAEKQEVFS